MIVAFGLALLLGVADGVGQTVASAKSGASEGRAPDGSAARAANGVASYTGSDARGVPRYTHRSFTPEERELLRRRFGVEHPSQLYISDSTPEGLLKYDTRRKRCRSCYVNSYRVGFVSIRRAGESWEELERRVAAMHARKFPRSARARNSSIADLDPAIRGDVERMLADAARAGFRVRIMATYRTPERETYLMMKGGGRTHTLTSLHSYGRAIDLSMRAGGGESHAPRDQWIRFRRWLVGYHNGEFRIIGSPSASWDWSHVEVPARQLGFHSIDAALARARSCGAPAETISCDFAPRLGLAR